MKLQQVSNDIPSIFDCVTKWDRIFLFHYLWLNVTNIAFWLAINIIMQYQDECICVCHNENVGKGISRQTHGAIPAGRAVMAVAKQNLYRKLAENM